MKYTISDIAKQCGVSKATVSRIINNKNTGFSKETKKLVMDKIGELHYRPNELARSVSTSESRTVGMLVPDIKNVTYMELICSAEQALAEQGYSLLLAQSAGSAETEQRLLLQMIDRRVDGVILCSGVANSAFLKEYRMYNRPIILIGRDFDRHISDGSIGGDNKSGAKQAIQYFLERGHQQIALIDGTAEGSGAKQRLEGYKEALLLNSIPFTPALVQSGEYTAGSGYRLTDALLKQKLPFTAVLTGGDPIAIGVLNRLAEEKIPVPGRVELIAFDNTELASLYQPPISSVHKPHHAMAREAVRMLLGKLQNPNAEVFHISVRPNLVLRKTTK